MSYVNYPPGFASRSSPAPPPVTSFSTGGNDSAGFDRNRIIKRELPAVYGGEERNASLVVVAEDSWAPTRLSAGANSEFWREHSAASTRISTAASSMPTRQLNYFESRSHLQQQPSVAVPPPMKRSRFDEAAEDWRPADHAPNLRSAHGFYGDDGEMEGLRSRHTHSPSPALAPSNRQQYANQQNDCLDVSGSEEAQQQESAFKQLRVLRAGDEDNGDIDGDALLVEEKEREERALMMLAMQQHHTQQEQIFDARRMEYPQNSNQSAVSAGGFFAGSDNHRISTTVVGSSTIPAAIVKNESGSFFNEPQFSHSPRKYPPLSFNSNIPQQQAELKQSRCSLISHPAAPPGVLISYAEECRHAKNFVPNPHHPSQREIQSPLEIEAQNSLMELRQESAFIDGLDPEISKQLTNAKSLLDCEAEKWELWHNPNWLEVDINRPVKLSKQVLIPAFRYPTVNYVGRILGFKGSTLARLCRKFKCFISINGAYSTRDRQQELNLLQSGDPRYAHYSSPMHIRIDVIAPSHLAHMRLAGILNFFHKLLNPNLEFDVEQYLADVDLSNKDSGRSKSKFEKLKVWAEEERRLEAEFDESLNGNNNIGSGRGGGGRGETAYYRGRSKYTTGAGFNPPTRYHPIPATSNAEDNGTNQQVEDFARNANGNSASVALPPTSSSAPQPSQRGGDGTTMLRGARGAGRGRAGGFVPRGRGTIAKPS